MKNGLTFLLLALAAAPLPGFAQERAVAPRTALTVVLDDNYPPYVFRDADGQLKGILPDQWELWQRETGVKVVLKAMDWSEAQRVMRAGQADVIDTIFLTEERAKLYSFTRAYARIEVPVFSHKDLGGIADIPSLQGFTIGVKAGDAVVEKLKAQGIDNLKEYPSYEAIILAAKNDELKVFSVDQPAAVYYLYRHGIAETFRQSFVLYTGEFHRAVWKARPELLRLVQDGFDGIPRTEYRKIDQKWMGTPFLLRSALREWTPWILLAATLVLFLAIVNFILRRQVHLRTAELRQALADLQHSQARLQSIFKVAPVGIGVLVDRTFVEANDVLCRMSGYPRDEIIGQNARLFYGSQEDYDRVGQEFYGQIARNGTGTTEIHGRRKNGDTVHWILCGAPLDPAHQEQGFIFTVLDISERKRAEEELRASREYFATVFDSINEAIFIGDPVSGTLLDVNSRMLDMYGFPSRAEALANGLGPMCAGQPPYTQAEAWARIQQAYSSGPQYFEWLARHRDGHCFWVEINICRVQIGATDRMIVTARDIGERKAAEENRQRYDLRLREAQKLESLGLLAGGVAHDFNNLLTAILGNIDLALLDIPHGSSARDDLQNALTATQRAAGLAQQMLAYSGKGRVAAEWVDVPAAVREITQLLRVTISKNAALHLHFPADLPAIEADASQLRQVLMNLIINASEALDNQPGSIDISAGVVDAAALPATRLWPHEKLPDGTYLFVEVADSGAGIAPELADKIFDPFFSTKFTGRGLGLAAVLGIMRGHKGAIQMTSTPGQGTTFRAFFPVKPQVPAPETAPASPQSLVKPGAERILLVDDEAGVRETASKLMTRLGFQVLCAADGDQAIALFRSQPSRIALVLLDLTMPHLDGVQTLAELRRIRPDIPVIVSSGHSESDVRQRFQGVPVDGYIPKPYTLENLRAALAQVLAP